MPANVYAQIQPYLNGTTPVPQGPFANSGIPELKPGQPTLATSAGGGPGYTPGRMYSYGLTHPGMMPNGQPMPSWANGNPPQFLGSPTPAPMPTTGQQPPMAMGPNPVPPAPLPQLGDPNLPPPMNPYARFGQMPGNRPMNPYAMFGAQ